MAFCSNCGKELTPGAKFCADCGTPVAPTTSSEPKRTTVFEGDIHKCPHCGETLKAFETVCPTCGAELRGAKSSSAISALAEKLERAESDKQRIIIIKNFPIPNTKEDIFEFMLLASTNFDSSYYATHLHEDDISDAWLIKIEQCYSKARLAFGSDPDFERIESIYTKIKSECAEQESRVKYEEKAQREAHERAENEKIFKKSKLRIAIIIFAVISALFIAVAFNDGRTIAGIIAIAMFVLLVVAFLMGTNVIKEKIRNMRLIPFILALVLMIPYFATYTADGSSIIPGEKDIETITWDRLAMGDKLPDFGKTEAEVVWDNDNVLILYFYNTKKTEFEDYIDSCKDFGYNIDVEDDGANFTAYNSEGYYLHLQWLDWGDKQLTIDLEDPKDKDTIIWPNSDLVEGVPVPTHLIGEVSTEYDTSYAVYLVGVEESYFTEYVSQCMANGFNIDYSKSKTYFRGENSNGISVTVEYVGFNTLYIWVTD